MPSNADIIKAIAEEAEAKGVDVPETEGLKNDQLAEILSGLKKVDRKELKAEKLAEARDAAAEKAKVEAEAEAKANSKYTHTICEGKALTTKRGILGECAGICAEDLAGGDKAIAAFVKSGHVKKK